MTKVKGDCENIRLEQKGVALKVMLIANKTNGDILYLLFKMFLYEHVTHVLTPAWYLNICLFTSAFHTRLNQFPHIL